MVEQFAHRSRRLSRAALPLAALASLLTAAPTLHAQVWQLDTINGEIVETSLPNREQLSQVKITPEVRQQVKLLDDASFQVREDAMNGLIEHVQDLHEIYAILEFDELTPEQRYRLLSVVRDALVRTPRGAIGISMNPVQLNVGGPIEIRVIDLIPGLPGERVLKIGDRIVEIDHKPLMVSNDLQNRVQSKKPGDKVHLKIKRTRTDEKEQPLLDANNQLTFDILDLDVDLGSADRLGDVRNQPNFPSPVQQRRQLDAMRAAETYAPRAQPIEFKGGPQKLIAATSRSVQALEDDVENFPAIQLLVMQRARLGFGDPAEIRSMRQQWHQRLVELQELAENPENTPEERTFLNRVIRRYIDLMEP